MHTSSNWKQGQLCEILGLILILFLSNRGVCVLSLFNVLSSIILDRVCTRHRSLPLFAGCYFPERKFQDLPVHDVSLLRAGVSTNGNTHKTSISNHFNRIFPQKPSILGFPHSWKPPFFHVANRWSIDENLGIRLRFYSQAGLFFCEPGMAERWWKAIIQFVWNRSIEFRSQTIDKEQTRSVRCEI